MVAKRGRFVVAKSGQFVVAKSSRFMVAKSGRFMDSLKVDGVPYQCGEFRIHSPSTPLWQNHAPSPELSTLHPTPCTLQCTPNTLHTTPYTMHPTLYALHPHTLTVSMRDTADPLSSTDLQESILPFQKLHPACPQGNTFNLNHLLAISGLEVWLVGLCHGYDGDFFPEDIMRPFP